MTIGTVRWIADLSLDGDGPGGVVITAYFLAGPLLFSALGRRTRSVDANLAAPDDRQRSRDGAPAAGHARD